MTSLYNSLKPGDYLEAQGCCGSFIYDKGRIIFENEGRKISANKINMICGGTSVV